MSKNGHNSALAAQPWDQQPKESNPAFAAFRCYLEMGTERSVRKAAKKLSKSATLLARWSKIWKWPERVRRYTKSLADTVDHEAEEDAKRKLPDIMGQGELLMRVSMLARANLLDLYDENGSFNIVEAKKQHLGYLLSSITTTETQYPNGTVRITHKLKLEGRKGFMELLGRHLGTWDWDPEKEDLDALLERLLGIQKRQLPGSLESVPGQVVEENGNQK